MIIDADTDNELDDLLAIAAALKSPKLEVIGMTAAQWDGRNNTVREGRDPWWNNSAYTSWLMNAVLVQLLDRTDLPLPWEVRGRSFIKRGVLKITLAEVRATVLLSAKHQTCLREKS